MDVVACDNFCALDGFFICLSVRIFFNELKYTSCSETYHTSYAHLYTCLNKIRLNMQYNSAVMLLQHNTFSAPFEASFNYREFSLIRRNNRNRSPQKVSPFSDKVKGLIVSPIFE